MAGAVRRGRVVPAGLRSSDCTRQVAPTGSGRAACPLDLVKKVAPILSSQDERVITRQLGRRPRPGTAVCRRCRYDYPQVTVTPPVNKRDGRWDMFPTVYWLTCPLLVQAIGRLEADGWITRYEQRLAEDPEFAAALLAAHRGAARDRVARIPPAWREELARDFPRQWQALTETGVGGTRFALGVKCLHAHYADFAGRGDNPIGRAVHEQLVAAGIPTDGMDACWRWCSVDEADGAGTADGAARRGDGDAVRDAALDADKEA